jgi:hypothetical protein
MRFTFETTHSQCVACTMQLDPVLTVAPRIDIIDRHVLGLDGVVGLQSIVQSPLFFRANLDAVCICGGTVQCRMTVTNVPLLLVFSLLPSLRTRVSFPPELDVAGCRWLIKSRTWAHRPNGLHFSIIAHNTDPPNSPRGIVNPPGVYEHDSATHRGLARLVSLDVSSSALVGHDDLQARPARYTDRVTYALAP